MISVWLILVIGMLWVLMKSSILWRVFHSIRTMRVFESLKVSDLPKWPTISVVIPACNEQAHIKEASLSLLATDYPELELILINDRSTDQTGEIIDELAQKDPRVKAVHIKELPAGWLGKVHALHNGVQHATGEFLLFKDADVYLKAGALKRAVVAAERSQYDQLAVFPKLYTKGLVQKAFAFSFVLAGLWYINFKKLGERGSGVYAGIGGFNLIRRASLEKTKGFEWLRLEVIDDFGLGLLLHNKGFKGDLLFSNNDIYMKFEEPLWQMIRLSEKNGFAACRFQKRRASGMILSTLFILCGWIALLNPQTLYWTGPILLAVCSVAIILFLYIQSRLKMPFIASFILPLGLIAQMIATTNSMFKTLKNQGINWRGTHYDLEDLKQGQRVKL